MKVWYIKCKWTDERWSHNRWGTTTSLPDLYSRQWRAQAQIDHGKVGHLIPTDRMPIIKEAELIL